MHYPVFEREGKWWFRDDDGFEDREYGPFETRTAAIYAYEEHIGFPKDEVA